MGLRSADEYVASLVDERRVVYRGKLVDDVTAVPDLRLAIGHAAIDFDLAEEPAARALAVDHDPASGEESSAYWRLPRSADDLRDRSRLIELATARGGTLVLLIKEIGSDAVFALRRVCEGDELDRVIAFHDRCRRDDLAVCVAQTDVKGDRSKRPHEQPDPDAYLRIVDSSPEGIVVRGAKAHTSVSVNANELVVLPTRAMGADDADHAAAFAIPVATPGLTLYVSPWAAGEKDAFQHPVSSRHAMLESLTVFDDVFVPRDRVFLERRPEVAGPLATAFVEYHRFTATSYKLPLLDAFVGAAAEITAMNGTQGAGHIQDKLAKLVAYAESVRGLTELAATRARVGEQGIAVPDPMTTNLAKYTFATGYHAAVQQLQDCAGGLLVTGPGDEEWADPAHRAVLEKYFAAASPASERLPMMHLIADLTARDYGGYQAVLATHAEGSIEAEKRHLLSAYDAGSATTYARELARLDQETDAGPQ